MSVTTTDGKVNDAILPSTPPSFLNRYFNGDVDSPVRHTEVEQLLEDMAREHKPQVQVDTPGGHFRRPPCQLECTVCMVNLTFANLPLVLPTTCISSTLLLPTAERVHTLALPHTCRVHGFFSPYTGFPRQHLAEDFCPCWWAAQLDPPCLSSGAHVPV